MAEIDEIKEEIGAIKTYLGFIVAFIITIGAGTAKVFLDNSSELLLVLGVISILVFLCNNFFFFSKGNAQ